MSTNFNNILVVQIAGIGDLILASMALRALKNGLPGSNLYLLTSNQAMPIGHNLGVFEKIYNFPIRELRNNKLIISQILKLIRLLRNKKFDYVVNLYPVHSFWGSIKLGLLFLSIRGINKLGHNRKGFGFFINKRIDKKFFDDTHLADAMLKIAESIGGINDAQGLEVKPNLIVGNKWRSIFENNKETRNIYIGINPGGDRFSKKWDPKKFSELANSLKKELNACIIILGGPGEENTAAEIEDGISGSAINLCGQLTIDELIYIIDKMNLLVSNDSGPMHIAVGTKTPVVAIFGPGKPKRFGPYTSPDLFRVVQKKLDCQPCKTVDCSNPVCIQWVETEEVYSNCKALLDSPN